VPDIYFGI